MKKSVVAVVLAVVCCATAAWSQGPPPGRGGGPGQGMGMPCPLAAVGVPQPGMLERMADMLQLSDDQMTKLQTVMAANGKIVQPLMQKSGEACKALHDAVLAAEYDAANVKALAVKAEKAEADVVAANIDVWTQVRAILTADQIAALQQAMNAPHQGPGQGQGPGGPPPPGGPGGPPPPQ